MGTTRRHPRWAVRTLCVSDALVLLTESQGEYLRSQEGVGRHVWESVREVVIPNGIVLPEAPGLAERARARAVPPGNLLTPSRPGVS